ncbi:hypothetical protein AC629_26270 [Bradyrhizobium sp. NAS80.1]|nr:hypothetical protein AC629_26270 [Bradyrhizobium sp. NAS80.1]
MSAIARSGMRYRAEGGDPTKSISNSAPDPRQASWRRREVLIRVQRVWRMGYHGLAARRRHSTEGADLSEPVGRRLFQAHPWR